jgi:hypothetical protein
MKQIKLKQEDFPEIDFSKIYKVNFVDVNSEKLTIEVEVK